MAGDLGRYSRRLVQLIYDPIPRNDDTSGAPIWCLGAQYRSQGRPSIYGHSPVTVSQGSPSAASDSHPSESSYVDLRSSPSTTEEEECSQQSEEDAGWPGPFLDDFESRVWMTYRSNFSPIPKSNDPKASAAMTLSVRIRSGLSKGDGFTSDTGWGCMIRSGQSLLANALSAVKLGRDWRRGGKATDERKLLSLFADDPKAPFSVHRFVEHGASACGKHPGQWFGPSATARCIQALTNEYDDAGLKVYITSDTSDVYEDGVMKLAKGADGVFQPTLILVGTRLGIDRVTPTYWEALKASLQMPQSIGVAGGRPAASHYFVGGQDSYFFYLDPHQTRPALPLHENLDDYSDADLASCHTRRLRRLHITEMDPSMLIGFLIRDEADWEAWKKGVTEVQGKAIVHVAGNESAFQSSGVEREAAIDEVEAFDTEDEALA
ncbi:cysteine protease atg4 [Aulographum hederae CBS 113979]|uniref:Cysteine protease n=1 Tax=Aulographum hederae CBS 113979 TaxID=1176131 RepID=A0A6G1GM90_9PEZI|nr:cysteine protease atg4 [Aulographum hederae CBS 113979]